MGWKEFKAEMLAWKKSQTFSKPEPSFWLNSETAAGLSSETAGTVQYWGRAVPAGVRRHPSQF
jgi:hypothetical protein